MMISVCGLGWMDTQAYGSVRQAVRVSLDEQQRDALSARKDIFPAPFNNFGRLDLISRMTCYAVGLAFKDAGLPYPVEGKEKAGIIGTNRTGCLDTDRRYFKDYLESGRTLGRGSLFIYTLPSSPLAEAAIHFGLQGAVLYIGGSSEMLAEAVSSAAEMIQNQEASVMLAGSAEENSAVYLLLSDARADHGEGVCDLEQARHILEQGMTLNDMVYAFDRLHKNTASKKP